MQLYPWLIYALAALFFWGGSGVTQKLATNSVNARQAFLWFCGAMVILTLALLPFFPLDWGLTPGLALLAITGGTLNGLGVVTSFAALERGGKASIVTPLTCLYPLVTILLAVATLGERPRPVHIVGMVLATVSGVLLTIESSRGNPSDS